MRRRVSRGSGHPGSSAGLKGLKGLILARAGEGGGEVLGAPSLAALCLWQHVTIQGVHQPGAGAEGLRAVRAHERGLLQCVRTSAACSGVGDSRTGTVVFSSLTLCFASRCPSGGAPGEELLGMSS